MSSCSVGSAVVIESGRINEIGANEKAKNGVSRNSEIAPEIC